MLQIDKLRNSNADFGLFLNCFIDTVKVYTLCKWCVVILGYKIYNKNWLSWLLCVI